LDLETPLAYAVRVVPSVSATIRALEVGFVVATWDRVFIHIWRGEATPRAVEAMANAGRAWLHELGENAGSSLSIVESTSPPPNERVRPLLSAFYREVAPHLRHQLFVAEGSGFRVALVRGVGLAVSTLAPSFLPFRFVSNVTEAAGLLAPVLSPTAGGPSALVEAVAHVRAKLDQAR
jgi:hypothetical protein